MKFASERIVNMDEVVFRADRFDALMKKRGFSNGELAIASKVSRTMIYYMRTGQRSKVSAKILAAVAGPLKTSLQWLMGETDDSSPIQKTMSAVAANIVDLVDKLPPSKQREFQELGKVLLAVDQSSDIEMIYAELMERITRLAELDGGEEALQRLEKELRSALGKPPASGPSVTRRRRRSKGDGESVNEPAQGDN